MKLTRKVIQKNIFRVCRFFQQWKLYGFTLALRAYLFGFNQKWGRHEPFIDADKHRSILHYLCKHYAHVINRFVNRPAVEKLSNIDPASPVWVCWWDGIETMPAAVRACYNSIRQYAGTHPVRFVSKYNFRDFVEIPEYILQKLNSGTITITHFSDILRAALLYEHGGIWMDATILLLKDITLDDMPFFTLKTTLKTDSITHIRWSGLSYASGRFRNPAVPEINRWTGFLLAGTKHAVLFEFMRDFFYAYWKEQNDLIDYLFIDYVIAIAYDAVPQIKKMFDAVPHSNTDIYFLENILNEEFSEERYDQCSAMGFHKLTWKKSFDMYTRDNKLTMYGYINDRFGDKQ